MTPAASPLSEVLRQLRADLALASATDAASLAAPRAALAKLPALVPDTLAAARRLTRLCGQAGDVADDATAWSSSGVALLGAITAAVTSLAEHIAHPDDFGRELLLTQAGQRLLGALGRDATEWFRPEPVAEAPSGVDSGDFAGSDLDAAATLILMVKPDERDDMERIREHLRRFATDESGSPLVRGLAREAESSLGVVLESIGTGADSDARLAEAADCVEKAVRARDEEEDSAPLAPKAAAPIAASSAMVELPSGDHELIGDFLTESREYLASAEVALLRLEVEPTDLESINVVFRAFHTVKGTSGFLGLTDVSAFAHEAESLFSRVRDREIAFDGRVPDLSLRALDVVKALLEQIERGLGGGTMARPAAYHPVLDEMARVVAGETPSAVAPVAHVVAVVATPATAQVEAPRLESTAQDVMLDPTARDESPAGRERRSAAAESSIRVSTDRLDRLIDMIGELVIAHTMLAQDESVQAAGQHDLSRKTNHAGKIVRELHDLSLSMRMVPLKPTFQKMTRLVRDVAHTIGKQVAFVTEGDETEIDRNMVDALSDPLVHMVRNAIDHGIELPDARAAAGKPRQGTVRLSAMHSGGSVVVQLQDDGKGLDRDRIVEKAIDKGLIDSAASMSDSAIFSLIFAPGFSTAEAVTDLSGRGVGMDVVRRNIEMLRGRIDIASTPGQGTTFTVRLPLTLAVTDGMLVRVGRERYIIPTTAIFKSFRPERDALSTIAGRGEMVRLHDQIMPLFRLHRLFDVKDAVLDPCNALIVVVASGDNHVALLVDALVGQQQVVAKSLGDGLGKIEGVSGGAILGDGRIGLILDVPELLVLVHEGRGGGAPAYDASAESRDLALAVA